MSTSVHQNCIFLKNIPYDTTYEALYDAISSHSSISFLKLLTIQYDSESYFLGSAYFSFKLESENADITSGKVKLQINNCTLEAYSTQIKKYFLRALVVVNLNKNYTEYNVLTHFAQFRPVSATIIPSKSGDTECAVVEFKQIRDRDAAFIRCKNIHEAVFYLYPSNDCITQEIESPFPTYKPRPPIPTTRLPTDFIFIHNNKRYICNKSNVKEVCKVTFDQNEVFLPDYIGNFKDVKNFIDGATITVNESNVAFLFNIGNILGILNFSELNPFSFITMNNIIFMAHCMQDFTNIIGLIKFITQNLKELNETQRLRFLPIKVISLCCDSPIQSPMQIDPFQLLIQLPQDIENQTPLANLIKVESLSVQELKVLIKNNNVDLNKIHDTFFRGYRSIADAPPYIVCDYTNGMPFNGIFAYLTELNHMNPHLAGLVNLEASSTQVSYVYMIIDYNSNDYFATRDVPNQWIKFDFKDFRVSLTGYSYKTHSINGNGHTRTWKVHGSVDGINWNLIHEMTNSNVLSSYGAVYVAEFEATPFYKVIKFTQTGTNTMSYYNFRVASIEFFGKIEHVG